MTKKDLAKHTVKLKKLSQALSKKSKDLVSGKQKASPCVYMR
jgi:hypothetical protein